MDYAVCRKRLYSSNRILGISINCRTRTLGSFTAPCYDTKPDSLAACNGKLYQG